MQPFIQRYSYLAVVLLCWACGFGAPLSEDLIVLTGGALVARGASFPLMALSAWLGQLGGDFILFSIGRRLGPAALRLPGLRRLVNPQRLAAVEQRFARQGVALIAAVRFLPGLRVPTYLVAGVSRLPPLRFLSVDALAAAVCAPLVTYLGFRFGPALYGMLQGLSHRILLGLAIAGLVFFVERRWRIARGLVRALSRARARPVH